MLQDGAAWVEFMAPRIMVLAESPVPVVEIPCWPMEKTIILAIEEFEHVVPGAHLIHAPTYGHDLLLSMNIDQELLNALRALRQEWYPDL